MLTLFGTNTCDFQNTLFLIDIFNQIYCDIIIVITY